MLNEALRSPFGADHWLKTIGIGAGLQFSAVLIAGMGVLLGGVVVVPALVGALLLMAVFWGYFLRVLRHAANEKPTLPVFDDWIGLGVNGVKFFGIILGYLSIPIVLIFIEVGFLTTSDGSMTGIGAVVYMVARLLALVSAFFVPVGLTNYILTDQMREAFALREVFEAALTGSYVKAVLLSLLFWFCHRLIQFLDIFIWELSTYVLYLAVGSVLSFYLLIVIFSLLGRGCGPCLLEAKDKQAAAS